MPKTNQIIGTGAVGAIKLRVAEGHLIVAGKTEKLAWPGMILTRIKIGGNAYLYGLISLFL
jgi:hypothetical protein